MEPGGGDKVHPGTKTIGDPVHQMYVCKHSNGLIKFYNRVEIALGGLAVF